MLDYAFDPKAVYLIAVTYGPESMALLDMMQKSGVQPVVLFIDYHKGAIMAEAKAKLRRYCRDHKLIFEAYDAAHAKAANPDDNFEKWSRDLRYAFFERMYKKHKAAALFLAHTQDDVIESYLLSKRFGGHHSLRGISSVSTYHGMMMVSPLLAYNNEDILEYIALNNVPYSSAVKIYETSESRSEIRRDIVEKLNEVERGQILSEITSEKDEETSYVNAIRHAISSTDDLNIREIIALSSDAFAQTLTDFVNAKAKERCPMTPAILAAIRKMCLDAKPNMSLRLKSNIFLVKEYDELSINNDGLGLPYSFVLKKPGKLSTSAFDLDFSKGAEDRGIHRSDYPLTIRSVLPQDMSAYGRYLEPVKKMLSAEGISKPLLRMWPVILNKDGVIIHVPHYRKSGEGPFTSILVVHAEETPS